MLQVEDLKQERTYSGSGSVRGFPTLFMTRRVLKRFKRFYLPTWVIWLLVPIIALGGLCMAPELLVRLIYHYMQWVPTVPSLN